MILFDLDGTLLDTAQDFIYNINLMRAERHLPALSFDDFRQHAYGESNMMVSYGFSMPVEHPEFLALKQQFLDLYEKNSTQNTVFFPGVEALLDYLDAQNIPWGIVTNKPSQLMTAITSHFKFNTRAKCIVTGDTLTHQKPHPAPLLHACALAAFAAESVWYVGDMETDIIAAKAAGMKSIAVTYGYHATHTDPHTWNADRVVKTPEEMLELIKQLI